MTDKTWARLSDNKVAELLTIDSSLIPGEDIPSLWTDDVTDVGGIDVGWIKGDDSKYAAPPAPALPPSALAAYASVRLAALLAAGRTFNVAAKSDPALNILCDGISETRADLAMLALFGQQNPTETKVWVDNNGVSTTLNGTQMVALATAAGNWISDGYAALGKALSAVAASPPKITTYAQVDAGFSTT